MHTAEVFTTAVSAISHFRFGTVDTALFIRLIPPGVIGAYILVHVPAAAATLLVMGIAIIRKKVLRDVPPGGRTPLIPLRFVGGG